MRLAYYYHTPVLANDDGMVTSATQARIVGDLARSADEIVLIAHRSGRRDNTVLEARLSVPNLRVLTLPPLPNPLLAWIFGPAFSLVVRLKIRILFGAPPDLTILRSPTTLAGWVARGVRGPKVLLIVGDFFEWSRSGRRGWFRSLAARALARRMWREAVGIARHGPVMVNGLAAIPLWRGMGLRVVHVSTNALDPAEVSSRTDTCQGAITRLLFVGRVEREKGISEAIETCESLRASGVEAILTVVGPFTDVHLPTRSSPAVVFVGPVPFGPELFQRYLDADILLSLSHFESFPRVIWEALGFGLPVVASDVGSIRATLGDGVVFFVPPHDSEAAGDAVERVLADGEGRRNAIARGRLAFEDMVRNTPTVGAAARRIAEDIAQSRSIE